MRRLLGAVAISGLIAMGGTVALAAMSPEEAVKARQDLMDTLRDASRTLRPMMNGEAPYDADAVRREAAVIRDHAGSAITDLFPEGSLVGDSEALPAIWENFAAFTKAAEDLKAAAGALVEAADNTGDTASAAPSMGSLMGGAPEAPAGDVALADQPATEVYKAVGGACRACHTDFRQD
ncbi:c-type cytochrome [Acuticoccus mangrovi]|uniref:Cytochrome c n=1 Tax=Acuticoccus mangrovi TaxID=2796142 RepID=A0A934IKL9_9HYPH|nr:cytochrome c [Acuticoccus mangrovi]MBJ3774053.1 cytochrome c [Acuticoccus mangrovi]